MKKVLSILILLIITLLSIGCNSTPETSIDTKIIQTDAQLQSKCNSYTTPSKIQQCKAIEAEDMSMCDPITHFATREDCILVIAEIVHDESQKGYCVLSSVPDYKIICQALILKDATTCVQISENSDENSESHMRDCIELVARKTKDNAVCNYFEIYAQQLKKACGNTNSCHSKWIKSAHQHKEDCETMVNAAIES